MSEARYLREALVRAYGEDFPMIGMPAPSSLNHEDYKVGYFSDYSILIWARHHGFEVLDEDRTYSRQTIEHLARCLGIFTKQRRAEMLAGKSQCIDGVYWCSDGSFFGLA